MNKTKRERGEGAGIWNPVFISVFVTNIMMYLGQQMIQTTISKYTEYLGAPATIVGVVASLFAVTALLMKVISAPAIDTFDQKYILAGAMCIMGISFAGFASSTSIPVIMGFRLLQGMGQAFTATCCLTLASNAVPQDKMGQGIAYFSLGQAISQAIGPTIGLKLEDLLGYRITFGIAALLMFSGAVLAIRIKTNFVRTKKFRISLGNLVVKEAIVPAGIMFFLQLTYCVINSFLVIYASKMGVGSNIGFFFTVYACTLLVTRPLIGKLSDRFGYIKTLIPAMFFFAAAFILISVADNIWVFLLAAFISAFGYGACSPAVQSLCMKLVPKEKRGAGSCMNYIGVDAGNLVGPPIAGMVVEMFGYRSMWRIMTLPIFAAMFIVITFRTQIKKTGSYEAEREEK